MRADDAWVEFLQGLISQAKLIWLIAAQIIQNRIRMADQLAQQRHAFRMLQVQRKATLIAVEGVMEMAIARAEIIRADTTPNITAFSWVFDLNDLSAHIGQQHGTERPGAILFNRQDRYAIQRQGPIRHQIGFFSIRRFAITRRWISLVPSPITNSGASRYSRSTTNSLE